MAAAVVGLAALAYQSGQATSAAKAFNAAIESGLANDTASQAILGIASAVGQLTTQIQSTSGPVNAMKQWNAQSESLSGGFQRLGYNLRATGAAFGKAFGDIPQSLQTWGTLGRLVKDFGHAFANFFSSSAGASVAASNNIKAYDAEITKLIAQQSILFRVAGQLVSGNNSLTKSSYTLAQAFALEDLAGVKSTDSLALADQKVRNLITGYQSMSVQGAILSSSVNAVTFASLQQQSGISNLTSAWTAFITLVTGGEAAFTTFQQQINTISHDLSGIAPAAITGSTALGGLSAASLQASSAFTTGVNQGNSLINALTMQASASGLATRGTDLLTAAVKDTVAQMIPMAGNSVAAQAALIALAQQGGFPASGSFQDLAKWVGTASGTMGAAGAAGGPAAQLNTITGILAKSSQNLTTDVQNLSTALGTTLSNAEAGAIALARGGVKPFNDFATAVANTGVSSDATRQAAIKLGDEFLQLAGNNVPAAQKEFESFAIGGLGLSQSQADALWNDILNNGIPALTNVGGKAVTAESQFAALAHNGLGLTQTQAQSLWSMFNQQNLDVMSTKAGGAKAQFIALAMNGLNLTNTQAQSLWRMFVQQKLDEAGTKAGETRAQFETLAGQLGLTKGAADKLWASLHAVAAGSPYTAVLHENGQGLFTITGTVIAASQGAGGSGNAAGGLASGGVVGQTMPVMVSKGEMVFSPSDSQRLAPAFRSLGVPGFAAGGYPSPGAFTGLVTRGTTPTADDVMVKVAKGSTVVSAEDSKKLASALGSGPPRYASGGYAAPGNYSGGFGGQAPATAQFTADFNNDMTGAMKTAMTAALKAFDADRCLRGSGQRELRSRHHRGAEGVRADAVAARQLAQADPDGIRRVAHRREQDRQQRPARPSQRRAPPDHPVHVRCLLRPLPEHPAAGQ